ncbi:hypothetical protein [Nostoc sp. 'Peltigera malacea cyanobiont' DB3992]|nr:hypothetical protein [Nostoc sp. 'Peltigera malacea cyanobiont' DB3992]
MPQTNWDWNKLTPEQMESHIYDRSELLSKYAYYLETVIPSKQLLHNREA